MSSKDISIAPIRRFILDEYSDIGSDVIVSWKYKIIIMLHKNDMKGICWNYESEKRISFEFEFERMIKLNEDIFLVHTIGEYLFSIFSFENLKKVKDVEIEDEHGLLFDLLRVTDDLVVGITYFRSFMYSLKSNQIIRSVKLDPVMVLCHEFFEIKMSQKHDKHLYMISNLYQDPRIGKGIHIHPETKYDFQKGVACSLINYETGKTSRESSMNDGFSNLILSPTTGRDFHVFYNRRTGKEYICGSASNRVQFFIYELETRIMKHVHFPKTFEKFQFFGFIHYKFDHYVMSGAGDSPSGTNFGIFRLKDDCSGLEDEVIRGSSISLLPGHGVLALLSLFDQRAVMESRSFEVLVPSYDGVVVMLEISIHDGVGKKDMGERCEFLKKFVWEMRDVICKKVRIISSSLEIFVPLFCL